MVKNGRVFGWQRYKCKACGYQFTKNAPAGKPMYLKLACHGLFMAGLSMREIAKLVGVTAQSVSRWIKKWHPAYMSELGEKSVLYRATSQNLADCLELSDKDELLVSSNILPSGTQYSIVIRLPRSKEKSLEK
jgi:predicted DNA-binding protein YlxM (UPF0122 family)